MWRPAAVVAWQEEWQWTLFHLALGMTATLVPSCYAGEDRIVVSKPLQPRVIHSPTSYPQLAISALPDHDDRGLS